MKKEELFFQVFRKILDYSEIDFVRRLSGWGVKVYDVLEKNNKILLCGDVSNLPQSGWFIYAVVFARIVGEFGKIGYGDHLSDEIQIDLDDLMLDYTEIECFFEEKLKYEKVAEIERTNTIGLEDIWTAMQEWKAEIYESLKVIYQSENQGDYGERIFEELEGLFGITNRGFGARMSAYNYVNSGFQY